MTVNELTCHKHTMTVNELTCHTHAMTVDDSHVINTQ